MAKSPQKITVNDHIQDRSGEGKSSPFVVRWSIDGKRTSAAFGFRVPAQEFRNDLTAAAKAGELFDTTTMRPVSWDEPDSLTFAAWSKEWMDINWGTWSPRSRRGHVEVISKALLIVVRNKAPKLTGKKRETTRTEIRAWLTTRTNQTMPAYLKAHSLALDEITKTQALAFHTLLTTKTAANGGGSYGSSAGGRYRRTMRQVFGDAVELYRLLVNPWPKSKAKRNSTKVLKKVDHKLLPSDEMSVASIERIVSHQPGSRGYRVLCYEVWLGGLRPSEATILHIEDCLLPEEGWGELHIWRANGDAGEDFTEPGEEEGPTKTGDTRRVPAPPQLVAIIREHIGERTSGLVVNTRNGVPVTASNWGRAWRKARLNNRWRLYDLRHACATGWLASGIGIGVTAGRLGHSPEVLLGTYSGIIDGDEETANQLIDDRHGTRPTEPAQAEIFDRLVEQGFTPKAARKAARAQTEG